MSTPNSPAPPDKASPDSPTTFPNQSPADLAADTHVSPIPTAPGCYTADLPEHWNFLMPSGGVLMTVALRAIRAELADAGLRPMSATTIFCQPVPHGPLSIRVDILRQGNVAAQARATLASPGMSGPGLEVSATFVRERAGAGIEVMGAEFPAVPTPDELPPAADDLPGNPHALARFFRNFDIRMPAHKKWWRADWQPSIPRLERWFRYLVPQHEPTGLPDTSGLPDTKPGISPRRAGDIIGPLDPLCLPPLVDTMAGALRQASGHQGITYTPSLDLTVHFLEDTTSDWLLAACRLRRARGGYASADIELWAADRTLVAYGTQTMILRRPPADLDGMQPG